MNFTQKPGVYAKFKIIQQDIKKIEEKKEEKKQRKKERRHKLHNWWGGIKFPCLHVHRQKLTYFMVSSGDELNL